MTLQRHTHRYPSRDLARSIRGTLPPLADFIGDDGKAATRFGCPSRLDCCIEGEQIGLVRDFLDQFHGGTNLIGAPIEDIEEGLNAVNGRCADKASNSDFWSSANRIPFVSVESPTLVEGTRPTPCRLQGMKGL
jgi:hypothetical protein